MKRFNMLISFLPVLLTALSCGKRESWTDAEKDIVSAPVPVRVLTVYDKADSLFLRTPCVELTAADITSPEYELLEKVLLGTVTSPDQDGVGIAGPQIGIGRRVVAVQRFDKEGSPFEVYPNIRVTAALGEKAPGREGCLSVPGWRGEVLRFQEVEVSYTSARTLKDTVELVKGFSAVIFQHECDHLDGVLYTDKVIEGTLRRVEE